ncbi:MAG: hypothetical protein M3153_02080 [Chloroflexota bacterium]|nr:hypothetical protein [Chloroflexota bacterium]
MTLLVAAAALAAAAPAAAQDAAVVLPGSAPAAVTIDLDGDGTREVVRLVQDESGTAQSVDAWAHDGARWAQLGETPMPVATVAGERAAPDGVAFALIRWRADGRERALVASAVVNQRARGGSTCCLTLFEIRPSAAGGIETVLLQEVGGGAQFLAATDIDADGNDDIVVHESRFGEEESDQIATLAVHRWNASRFDTVFERTDRDLLNGVLTAETDGVSGTDLLFGPVSDGRLHRLAWADGALREEEAAADLGGPPGGWIAGVADKAIIVMGSAGLSVVRWDRGRPATTLGRIPGTGLFGATAIGDGPDALVAVQDGSEFASGQAPTTTLYNLAGRRLGKLDSSAASEGFLRLMSGELPSTYTSLQNNVYPYTGPMPDGIGDGQPAFIVNGTLVQPGGPAGFRARPMASLIGMQPLGLAGPEDGWAVLTEGYGAAPGGAYLSWGGLPPEWGKVALTPLAELLRPDDEAAVASIGLHDAVELTRTGAEVTLLAQGDGFEVSVSAAPGSLVMFGIDARFEEHAVDNEPIVLEAEPPRNATGNREFEAMLYVVGPSGRGMSEHWTGTFVREPPELSVSAETTPLALSATLDGEASPGSMVSVDDMPIATDGRGRFTASVDAPLWPSQLVVSARDPLGNETTERVEVIGLVDYRGLPWAAILVAATLAVGAGLYVRTPRRRALPTQPDGDGRLEELDLDAIDGGDALHR